MGEEVIRWTVSVDRGTDIELRAYLAQRGMKKGDLSKFIEESVKWRLLDLTLAEAQQGFADMSEDEIEALVDEAASSERNT